LNYIKTILAPVAMHAVSCQSYNGSLPPVPVTCTPISWKRSDTRWNLRNKLWSLCLVYKYSFIYHYGYRCLCWWIIKLIFYKINF